MNNLKSFWLSKGLKITIVMVFLSMLLIFFGQIIWLGLIFVCPECSMQITLAEDLVYVAFVTVVIMILLIMFLPMPKRNSKTS